MKIQKGTKVKYPSSNPYNDGVLVVQQVEITINKDGSWKVIVVMTNSERYKMVALRRSYREGKVKIWNN